MKQAKGQMDSSAVDLQNETEQRCPEGLMLRKIEGKGTGVFAQYDWPSGKKICDCSGYKVSLNKVTAMCLQVDENVFLQGTGEFDDFVNHSCDPNCVIRFENGTAVLYVLKDIKAGEELTFDYNTSDWDMLEQEENSGEQLTFDCLCQSSNCVGRVKGFRHLTAEQRNARKNSLSPLLIKNFSVY